MLDRLEFVLSEALTALRRNGMMTFSAINTSAIALLLLGGLGYSYFSLATELDTLPAELELKLSILPGTNQPRISQMARDLRSIDGVSKVVLLPRDVEWRKELVKAGREALLADLPNPLPDQFKVTLSDLRKGDYVKGQIGKHPLLLKKDPIRDARAKREYVIALIDFVRLAGLLLGAITIITAATLIYNTVHLTVLARRRELSIMRLVGASHGTIQAPFLLEGGLQGLTGGLAAGLALWGLAAYLHGKSLGWQGALASPGDFDFPALRMVALLAILGAVMGMLSAGLSVRKYLRIAR